MATQTHSPTPTPSPGVDVESVLKGKSHRAVAIAVNVDKSYITMILNGKREPSTKVLRELAAYLGYSMDVLDQYLVKVRRRAQQAA